MKENYVKIEGKEARQTIVDYLNLLFYGDEVSVHVKDVMDVRQIIYDNDSFKNILVMFIGIENTPHIALFKLTRKTAHKTWAKYSVQRMGAKTVAEATDMLSTAQVLYGKTDDAS